MDFFAYFCIMKCKINFPGCLSFPSGIPRWLTAVLAFLLVLLTYPAFEPDFGVGLDSSYVWGLNYLFDNDYPTLTSLSHPYGPFAWLRLPVVGRGHYAFFLVFFPLVKFAFAWMVLEMSRRRQQPLLLALAALVPACLFANVEVLVVADVALLVASAIEQKSLWRFFLAAALSLFALSIKISIGTSSCSILFVGWLVLAFYHKDLRFTIYTALSVPLMALAVGLAVWHTFPAMWSACVGMLHLVGGYSEAVLMPEHRGWALVLFPLAIVAMALTLRGRWARYLFLLLLIPLFSFWKYGVTREDFYHFRQFLMFAVCFIVMVALAQERFRWQPWLFGIAAYILLTVNLSALNTSEVPVMTAGPKNLVTCVINGRTLADSSQAYIDKSLSSRRLDGRLCEMIGNATVDCYPWEHVYVAANHLRWQPHRSIELASGNSLWLNRQSAMNFGRLPEAVDYVLLHRVNYGGEDGLLSLDGRYLLNDEPAIVDSMLCNYSVVDSGGWYGLLLRHGGGRYSADSGIVATADIQWNEWVLVPLHPASTVLRADLFSRASFAGWLKGTLYKPDIYYVDYRMPNGDILTYRYSRTTAESGLWLGPMLGSYAALAAFFEGRAEAPAPTAIRFRTASMNGSEVPSRLQKPRLTIRFRKALTLMQLTPPTD